MVKLLELNGQLYLLDKGRMSLTAKVGAGKFTSNLRIGTSPGDPGNPDEPGIAGSFIAPFSFAAFELNNIDSGGESDYGERTIGKKWHDGIDFGFDGATYGAPVRAIAPGVVIASPYGDQVAAGPYPVTIDHGVLSEGVAAGKRLYSVNWHMRMRTVTAGDVVESSETVIGEIGAMGQSGGPHLHLELHFDVLRSNQYSQGSDTGSQDPVPLFDAYGGWR